MGALDDLSILHGVAAVVIVAELMVLLELVIRRRRGQARLMEAVAWSMVDPVTELLTAEAFDRRVDVETRRASREHAALVEVVFPHARLGQSSDPLALSDALQPGEIGGLAAEGGTRILLLDPSDPAAVAASLVKRMHSAGIEATAARVIEHVVREADRP